MSEREVSLIYSIALESDPSGVGRVSFYICSGHGYIPISVHISRLTKGSTRDTFARLSCEGPLYKGLLRGTRTVCRNIGV